MVTFYVRPDVGLQVIDAVAARQPGEVWLNPGSESDALIARARALGIEPIAACSIMGIGLSPVRTLTRSLGYRPRTSGAGFTRAVPQPWPVACPPVEN